MPGVPSIYYGSEFGIEGMRTAYSDYELRPCLDLDSIPNPNYELLEHIKKLGVVRLALEALKYGDFENINIQNEKLVYRRKPTIRLFLLHSTLQTVLKESVLTQAATQSLQMFSTATKLLM